MAIMGGGPVAGEPTETETNCLGGWGYARIAPIPISAQVVAGTSRQATTLGLPYYAGLDQAIPALQAPRLWRQGVAATATIRGERPYNYDRLTLKLPRFSEATRGTRSVSLRGRQATPSRMSQVAVPPVFYPTTWR